MTKQSVFSVFKQFDRLEKHAENGKALVLLPYSDRMKPSPERELRHPLVQCH